MPSSWRTADATSAIRRAAGLLRLCWNYTGGHVGTAYLGTRRSRFRKHARSWHAVSTFALLFLFLYTAIATQAVPTRAQVVSQPPLEIAIFISSRKDLCFDPGDVTAIKRLTLAEQDRINASGGVLGRELRLRILDDERMPNRAVANVREALASPNTVAMVGLSYSDSVTAIFNTLAADIESKAIPFLSDITVTAAIEKHTNVFTIRPSQDDERVPVMAEFIRAAKMERPAFVGLKDQPFSASLGDGLRDAGSGVALVADHRLAVQDNKLDPSAIASVVADLKQKNADLVVVAVGSQRIAPLLAAFATAGMTPPLFVTGRIETIVEAGTPEYPGDIYQLAWDDLPHVFSDRLRQRIVRNGLDNWMFEGAKITGAPGWATGACKERPDRRREIFDSRNMRAIGRGTQYADMVGLVTEALSTADPRSDVEKLRSHVLKQLTTTYAVGRGAFRGSFENWSFRPNTRTADRTPFIIMRPNGLGASQLAPRQFVRLKTDRLRPIDTLYIDIDLIRIARVDENDKSFFAEFYLSMRGQKASINDIELANSFLDPRTNDRQINVQTLHDGEPSEIYPDQMKIYRVAGKFMFEPRLTNYPFDTQRFSINIQPKSGDTLFIVQPPPGVMRDKVAASDGWSSKEQYVGYDEDFLPTIDAWNLRQSIVPFYRASFVWLMKRETTEYYLRVVVPLVFILIVAYLSIFIPQSHFEAIVTIQVTALLSAVALYLALPKIEADGTTVSDRIFLFMYMAVSVMVAISIIRISRPVARRPWLGKILGVIYVVLIPALVTCMGLYIYRAAGGDG